MASICLGLNVLTHWGKMPATLADDIFKRISTNENFWILYKNSLKYIP